MREMKPTVRAHITQIGIMTFLFGFAAHGFRYFIIGVSHDSIGIFQNEAAWQIALGRFLQPVYVLLRGKLCSPLLIGLFSLLWLTFAIFFLTELLDIRSRLSILLICGILTTNAAISLTNATYQTSSDIFMLACFLAVLGIFLLRRYRFGFLPGALLIGMVIALYQSYLEVAVFLALMLVVKDCLDGLSGKTILINGAKALGTLLLGLVTYYLCLKVVLSTTGVELATSYNGISSVGDFSNQSIILLFLKTYLKYGVYALFPRTYHPFIAAELYSILIVVTAYYVIKIGIVKKIPKINAFWLLLAIAIMPFGINVVYFISKGTKHDLMTYSFYLIFVFTIFLREYYEKTDAAIHPENETRRFSIRKHWISGLTVLGMAVLILNNIIFANNIYLLKELEYESTISTFTRIIDRMEQTEGYVVDETPVAIIGMLSASDLAETRNGFEYIGGEGMYGKFATTYYGTYEHFFNEILGYPINLIQDENFVQDLAKRSEVVSMPTFPATGSCAFVDGIYIIKLS